MPNRLLVTDAQHQESASRRLLRAEQRQRKTSWEAHVLSRGLFGRLAAPTELLWSSVPLKYSRK